MSIPWVSGYLRSNDPEGSNFPPVILKGHDHMPAITKAHKLIALSAFALSATLFSATTMRAEATTADATAISTSADVAAPVADTAAAEPQATAPAAAPAAPAAPPVWSVGPIDFSGLIDGYYNFNANHPNPATNQLRNFDYDANSFSLNMAKLTIAHTADPVGFRIDLGFGKAFNVTGSGISSCNGNILLGDTRTCDSINDTHLEQAYVSWVPGKGHGFEADFGEFVTFAGAEVIETKDNWNYSRSLMFTYMLPYYHFGLRTSFPVTKKDTVGFQVVNGWNNITDNNAGKTLVFNNVYTTSKFVWAADWITGPENTVDGIGTDTGFRNLFDTTLTLTPTSKLSAYINYDYLQNRNAGENLNCCSFHVTDLVHQQGIAFAARYQTTDKIAFAGRYEYIADESGAITGTPKASLNEFTITGEYKMAEGMLARLEYRRDHTDNPFFVKGLEFANNLVKSQSTLEFGVTAFFGPKR